MFATIKSLIPEPRQADQPRHYVGRHRQTETAPARALVPAPSAPSPLESIPANSPLLPEFASLAMQVTADSPAEEPDKEPS